MVRLFLLGSLELSGPDAARYQHVTRRYGLVAILAHLALEGRPFCSRDIVQALFWPEHDQARARHSLNQALYSLRKKLGDGAIESRGDAHIGLSRTHVWCDAAALLHALDRGQWAAALALYRGDLMPGFYSHTAPGLEQWLEGWRERLRRRVANAAWQQALSEQRHGRLLAAGQLAQRAAELTREELVIQSVIRMLDQLGDRAAALHLFASFKRRLAAELGIEPSPETQTVVSAIRSRATPYTSTTGSAALHP